MQHARAGADHCLSLPSNGEEVGLCDVTNSNFLCEEASGSLTESAL